MRHRHINNHHTFGMLLNRQMMKPAPVGAALLSENDYCEKNVTVETVKRRHALLYGVPSSYWRLRHHHGYVISRPV
jgi:hypothetical protein